MTSLDQADLSKQMLHIVMAAQLPDCRTAGAIAAKVEQGHQLKLSVDLTEWLAASVTSGKTHDRQAQAC